MEQQEVTKKELKMIQATGDLGIVNDFFFIWFCNWVSDGFCEISKTIALINSNKLSFHIKKPCNVKLIIVIITEQGFYSNIFYVVIKTMYMNKFNINYDITNKLG